MEEDDFVNKTEHATLLAQVMARFLELKVAVTKADLPVKLQ
jgi:hypothetical protein